MLSDWASRCGFSVRLNLQRPELLFWVGLFLPRGGPVSWCRMAKMECLGRILEILICIGRELSIKRFVFICLWTSLTMRGTGGIGGGSQRSLPWPLLLSVKSPLALSHYGGIVDWPPGSNDSAKWNCYRWSLLQINPVKWTWAKPPIPSHTH